MRQHIGVYSHCHGVYLFECNATLGEVDATLGEVDATLGEVDARLDGVNGCRDEVDASVDDGREEPGGGATARADCEERLLGRPRRMSRPARRPSGTPLGTCQDSRMRPVEACYENGFLKPAQPLKLGQGEKVASRGSPSS